MDALRAENASLKQQLKDALDELAATQAKLKELEDSILKGGGEGGDDDVFERLEWERKLRRIADTLEAWVACQRRWIYLEGLFI